jgi:hypothetical protein
MTATSVRYNVAVLDMDTRNPEGGTWSSRLYYGGYFMPATGRFLDGFYPGSPMLFLRSLLERSAAEGLRPVEVARITTGQRQSSRGKPTVQHVGAVSWTVQPKTHRCASILGLDDVLTPP